MTKMIWATASRINRYFIKYIIVVNALKEYGYYTILQNKIDFSYNKNVLLLSYAKMVLN